MLRLVDRYVIREIVPPFLLALVVFTFLLQIAPLGDVAERLIAKGVSGTVVAYVMVTLLPQALAITIPMAFLLGLLVAFGRLSSDSEWTALQACGVSTFRLIRPAFALGVLAWAATSWVMIWAVPWGNQTYREITYSVLQARAEGEVKPRVFFDDFPNFVLYARDVVPSRPGWTDVFVAETGIGAQPVIYIADHGRLLLDRAKRTVELVLVHGTRHVVTPDQAGHPTEKYEVSRFETLVLSLDPNSVFPRSGPQKGDQERTIAELRQEIAEINRRGTSAHNPVMAIQKKFSIPAACLVFAVMGLALGVSNSRTGKLASFVLGLAVIFAYYTIMYTSESLAKAYKLPAALAPWMPNIVLAAVAIALLIYRNRSLGGFPKPSLPFRRRRPAVAAQNHSATRGARTDRRTVLVVRVPQMWVPRPGLLDRYVSKLFARLFLLSAASLLGIFYIATFIDLSDKLFKGQATVGMLAEYYWFATPQFIYWVIPLAVLIAGLVTVGALTRNSELVVMKACGISLYRVAAPLIAWALAASAVLFFLGERVLPDANRRANEVQQVMRHGPGRTLDVFNRRWVVGRDGEIYHYAYFDPRQRTLDHLSVYEFNSMPWALTRRTFVTRAVVDRAAAATDNQVAWSASLGWVREFTPGGEPRSWTPFVKRTLMLEPADYFGRERPAADQMTYGELARHIDELRAGGFNVVPLAVQLQRKLSFPVVTLVMILIAVPFAVMTGRRGALYGVGVGIVLALSYWVMGNVFAAIGSAGLLAPALAAWAPNSLFGAAAAYLLLTVNT